MKIDAIFVLPPEDPPPSMPTRRAVLIALGSFAVGTALGGACGYSMAAGKASPESSDAGKAADAAGPGASAKPVEEIELKPSGDAELDYWRKLAVKAPLDDLFAEAAMFLLARVGTYPQDEVLWHGVGRLAAEAANDPNRQINDADLLVLISQIEGIARPKDPSLRDLVPKLRNRRRILRDKK